LSDFAAMTAQAHLAQLIISGSPNTVYVDNIYLYSTTTGTEDNLTPDDFALKQNFPNPFNPATTIHYSLVESGHVTLKLFNIKGQEVATLVDESAAAGEYTYSLNAGDLVAGTYLYALTAGNQTLVKKMVLIK